LTELQLAVLAAVRDGEVESFRDYNRMRFIPSRFYPVNGLIGYRSHGHAVTRQVKALRSRHLIWYSWPGVFKITDAGTDELARHPEF
jgi:hypothetical protein